jgi:PAS domain S-box-containing protein
MSDPIRILYVDDYPLDRELVRDALEKEHDGFQIVEATSRADFEARLAEGTYDLVLSDFNILGFEGLQVVEAVHAKNPRVPVVIVTGTGSEEIAVEAMKRGAADYVIKTPKHIQRLSHTIHAVLEKKHLEDERDRTAQERDRLFNYSIDLLCIVGLDGYFKQLNPAWEKTLGWTNDELKSKPYLEFVHRDDREATAHATRRLVEGKPVLPIENRYLCKDGTYKWIAWNSYPVVEEGLIFAVARDMTEPKHAEEQIEQQLQHLAALHAIDMVISSSFDLRITLDAFLEHVTTQLRVDAAMVLLLNPHLNTLEFAAGHGFRGSGIRHLSLRLGENYAGQVALERRPVSIPNLTKAEHPFSQTHLTAGEGFIAYNAVPLIAKGQVKGVLEVFHRAPLNPDPDWLEFFETLAGQAAIAIDNTELFDNLQRSNSELMLSYDTTLEGWSRALDLRDKETEGHTQRVTEMTVRLARAFGMPETELLHIRRGALLHDIGKMGIPDAILLKPSALTDEEWKIMRKHPEYAYALLSPIAYLRPALDIPYCHHEKWDGTGYPRGLRDETIPLAARIFAIVDVWDALRSDRPYRKAWAEGQAREHIRAGAGTHFDPRVAEVFLKMRLGEA